MNNMDQITENADETFKETNNNLENNLNYSECNPAHE
jgi:hypothetical protein